MSLSSYAGENYIPNWNRLLAHYPHSCPKSDSACSHHHLHISNFNPRDLPSKYDLSQTYWSLGKTHLHQVQVLVHDITLDKIFFTAMAFVKTTTNSGAIGHCVMASVKRNKLPTFDLQLFLEETRDCIKDMFPSKITELVLSYADIQDQSLQDQSLIAQHASLHIFNRISRAYVHGLTNYLYLEDRFYEFLYGGCISAKFEQGITRWGDPILYREITCHPPHPPSVDPSSPNTLSFWPEPFLMENARAWDNQPDQATKEPSNFLDDPCAWLMSLIRDFCAFLEKLWKCAL